MRRDFSENKVAVSAVVGIVVMLAITLLSISIMVLYTMPAINDMQDMAKAQKIEQAFTVFDSRTSKAALGESPLQTTGLSLMGGNVEVMGEDDDYNESRIMIIGLSSDSTWYNNFDQNYEYWNAWESYEGEPDFAGICAPMGKILYTSGDRTIAYEGGGVWSKYPTGGTIMVSPPEFHFNGETLTLPVMHVKGNTSVAGTTDASITVASSNDPDILFPNTTLNNLFVNPLEIDKIIIYIQSDFYDGWADYAETLISTTATRDHANKTAIITLKTLPKMGTYSLDQNFKIARLNESNQVPIDKLSYYYVATSTDASDFDSIKKMTVTASAGTKYLEYLLTKNYVEHIAYTDSSVGSGNDWELWVQLKSNDPDYSVFPVIQEGNKNANSTYDLRSDSYIMRYATSAVGADEEWSWDEISPTKMLPNETIVENNEQTLENISQHYIRLMSQEGIIDCTWNTDMTNEKINFDESFYTVLYDVGSVVNFLHITSNELEATID